MKEARSKINRAEGTWEDHYRLAVAYHKELRAADAHAELSKATKLNPIDGRLLCGLAHLAVVHKAPSRARELYQETIALNPNTLWHIIAADALQQLP